MKLTCTLLLLLTALAQISSFAAPGDKKWEFATGSGAESSPAIGADGTVYIGSWDHNVYALDGATGAKKWEFATGWDVTSSPTIGADGTVYIGSGDNKVYALDGATGTKKWEFDTGHWVYSSPAIGADGTVYIGSWDHNVYALDGITGAKKWEFATGDSVASSPAIGADGTVYIGSDDNKVYALDGATGTKKWEFATGRAVDSCPTIGADGTVYIGSWDHNVYALDGATGAKKWEFEAGREVTSSPTIGADGTVYIGSGDTKVYALDGITGDKKWEFATGHWVYSSPAIGADGTVYIGSYDNKVYALDGATGTKKWEFATGGDVYSSPAIGADGTVYIVSVDHNVYALDGASPLADSSWPMRGRNVGHTASSEIAAGPPRIVVPPTDREALLGTTTSLGVIAGGTRPMTFRWQKDGMDLVEGGRVSGVTAALLRLANLQPEDAGSYRVVVSNGEGSETSAEAELTLRSAAPGELRWAFETSGSISSSPAVGADGTVYIGSDDNNVYALDGSTGAKKWEFATGGDVDSSPAIGADGTVYIGSWDSKVYSLDGITGDKKWEFEAGGASSPAIGADGTVYIGSYDNKVYALDGITGDKKWEFATGGWVDSSPAIGANGTVYVGSKDGYVYALDGLTGAKKWEFAIGFNYVYSSPAIGADGTVYIGSDDNNVYALDVATGAKKWEFETVGHVYSSPAIGADGTVYIGGGYNVYALDVATGAKKWEFETGRSVSSSPAIGADGTVYIGSLDNKVYALDGLTGAMKWEFATWNQVTSSPAIGANGTVYIGSHDGYVYALAGASPLADSSWPMRGNNARHTGRVQSVQPIIPVPPASAVGSPGADIVFKVVADGQGVLRYQWRFNGVPISGAVEVSLVLIAVTEANVGSYDVVVSNDHGSVTSPAATLTLISVNQPPTFTKGADQSVQEDAGAQSIAGWATDISAGPANESSQTLSFLVTNDHNELFAVQPAVSPEGTLSFTPAPDASGTATVTVTLKDDGGTENGGQDASAPQTFTITVLPLNDAPSFVKGADQSVQENAGAQSIAGWATDISVGPANESSQTLTFLVTSDHNELFAVQPAVSPEGILSFTPAPDASGTATVTVTLKDDGGTENGGLDSSSAQTFVITVIKSEPPQITSIGWEEGRLTIRWEGGHQLQWAQDPSGPWDEVPEAHSPFDIVPEGDRRFYRLQQVP